MKRVLVYLIISATLFLGNRLFAQENPVLIIPISKGFAFYYDKDYHDYCGKTKYLELNLDTLNQIILKDRNINLDTLEISNDHYGLGCLIYDACIVGMKFYVNVYIPKEKVGLYEFDVTPVERQLVEYAIAHIENYNDSVFLPKYHGLNPSDSFSCHDCDAASYIRMKKKSINKEYLIHSLADSIPTALVFLRDVIGAVVENHCRDKQLIPKPIENHSIRKRFYEMAKEHNCPTGLEGDNPIPFTYSLLLLKYCKQISYDSNKVLESSTFWYCFKGVEYDFQSVYSNYMRDKPTVISLMIYRCDDRQCVAEYFVKCYAKRCCLKKQNYHIKKAVPYAHRLFRIYKRKKLYIE